MYFIPEYMALISLHAQNQVRNFPQQFWLFLSHNIFKSSGCSPKHTFLRVNATYFNGTYIWVDMHSRGWLLGRKRNLLVPGLLQAWSRTKKCKKCVQNDKEGNNMRFAKSFRLAFRNALQLPIWAMAMSMCLDLDKGCIMLLAWPYQLQMPCNGYC